MLNMLFVDDERNPNYIGIDITIVRTFAEAMRMLSLRNKHWDMVSLDHDLGNGKTGYDITVEIESLAYNGVLLDVDKFIIHSANPIGRMKMYQALHKFYNVEFVRAEDMPNV